jgi:hypothetical protein
MSERTPFWLTAFADFPAPEFDAGVAFWVGTTGHHLSARRGQYEEFASLLPSTGDEYLRVQRLGEGPTRVHLDLHVGDPWTVAEVAEGLGAELVADSGHGYLIMRSPAGQVFCLVTAEFGAVPAAHGWPGGHVSRVTEVCLDVPAAHYPAEVTFWKSLLGGEWVARGGDDPLVRRAAGDWALGLLLQPAVIATEVSGHLHVSTDDRPAEVGRLTALGARARAVRSGWTVMEAPGGLSLCVLDMGDGRTP